MAQGDSGGPNPIVSLRKLATGGWVVEWLGHFTMADIQHIHLTIQKLCEAEAKKLQRKMKG